MNDIRTRTKEEEKAITDLLCALRGYQALKDDAERFAERDRVAEHLERFAAQRLEARAKMIEKIANKIGNTTGNYYARGRKTALLDCAHIVRVGVAK